MISTLRRGVNAVLFAIACLLAADTANAILAAVLLPAPEREAEAAVEQAIAAAQWKDRQAILDRNVFESSTLAPPPVETTLEDDLEATQLPLTLLGTAASSNPRFAWAAIQDRNERATLVVGIGGAIQDKATVVRIERQRVVLLEDGVHRELVLEEDALTPRLADSAPNLEGQRAAVMRAAERRRAARGRPGGEPVVTRDQVDEALRNPAEIFSQARILPKYEEGQMRGVQISQIKPGSLFEQVGIREGDVITKVNGIEIKGPEQSPLVLKAFTESDTINAEVIGADGTPRPINQTIR